MSNVHHRLALSVSLCAALGCGRTGMPREEVDGEVSRALPVGADSQRVVAVLDSMHIEHSSFDAHDRTITAMARDVSRTLFVRTDVQFVFAFDEQGRLRAHTTKQVRTGL